MATVNISSIAKTWNDAGTTFTAIGLNVTDTASNAASLLMDLKVGGASKFSVDKAGEVGASGLNLAAGGAVPTAGFNAFSSGLVQGYASGAVAMKLTSSSFQVTGGTLEMGGSGLQTSIYHPSRDVLVQARGANPQTLAAATTYTDASNYERTALENGVRMQTAGTGAANIDLPLVPAGTGVVQFGTHAAIGAETVTGYITIKDSGGTSRKIAVVS